MPQSLCRMPAHLIFSTKGRLPWITPEMLPEVHAYLAAILRGEKCSAISVGGIDNHVHILFCLPKTECMSEMVKRLKVNSTNWIHQRWRESREFSWQTGYAAYGVSAKDEAAVVAYIDNQAAHHGKQRFEEELILLLDENRVVYDEAYLWD